MPKSLHTPEVDRNMQSPVSATEIHLTATVKRIFSNEVLPVYSVVRYDGRLFRIISVADTSANAWRGKYRYEANMLSPSAPVPSGVIELILS